MIKQLKKIFPSLTTHHSNEKVNTKEYRWFTTPDHEIIGIEHAELTKKNERLLELMFTPYHGTHAPVSHREKIWSQLINKQDTSGFIDQPSNFRFIFFNLSKPLADPTDFRSAFDGLYSNRPALIWIDQQSGVIIEEEDQFEDESLSYHEIIEVFQTDFYFDVSFYIGPYLTELTSAHSYFHWIQETFEVINQFSIKPVMNYVTAIPYLLTTLKETNHGHFLITAILKDTADDDELLRSIQTFLECNSNVSLAAKKLYMHRNSLQYRIDKFIEKTGIDVKQFESALSVYLILLLKRHLN